MSDHHEHHTGDYVRGEMDISEHKSTYSLFGFLTKWGSLVVSAALLFLVVLTCVKHADWVVAVGTAFASAIFVAVVGWFLLRTKPEAH